MASDSDLEMAFEVAINMNNRENVSNTPDYILAAYLMDCLRAYEKAHNTRAEWFGSDQDISYKE